MFFLKIFKKIWRITEGMNFVLSDLLTLYLRRLHLFALLLIVLLYEPSFFDSNTYISPLP
ncbi:hypothetical protein HMPREF1546_03612 [Oscillibacter sp. KLE 1745]|nr:hypothetical protein HMPREF1546_03612 [Oscillibacter sp. KLE 1745]